MEERLETMEATGGRGYKFASFNRVSDCGDLFASLLVAKCGCSKKSPSPPQEFSVIFSSSVIIYIIDGSLFFETFVVLHANVRVVTNAIFDLGGYPLHRSAIARTMIQNSKVQVNHALRCRHQDQDMDPYIPATPFDLSLLPQVLYITKFPICLCVDIPRCGSFLRVMKTPRVTDNANCLPSTTLYLFLFGDIFLLVLGHLLLTARALMLSDLLKVSPRTRTFSLVYGIFFDTSHRYLG
ncbi:hypothetical protein BDN70DRAFT_400134 [Pholiota conissans]|uniref:Uncharacterized protein n=1 Tax=Pholiota conissans TaxID=109636 RepID=A0A9P6CX82_9AGAR|nr:hypothetical protein BDN70DRAFT_400134 [Pholiota conissans]